MIKTLLFPVFGGAHGDDLLRQNIERSLGDDQLVEFPLIDSAQSRGDFDQLVASSGEQAAFGNRTAPVAGASYTLKRDCDRARRTDVTYKVNRTDVDSEFKRRGCDQRLQLAIFQSAFSVEAQFARQ